MWKALVGWGVPDIAEHALNACHETNLCRALADTHSKHQHHAPDLSTFVSVMRAARVCRSLSQSVLFPYKATNALGTFPV